MSEVRSMRARSRGAVVGLALALALLMDPGAPALAQAPERPPRPAAAVEALEAPRGAHVRLDPAGLGRHGYWSVVQWLDARGDWHDVEGWRGHPDADGGKRWWVQSKDFGTGPFRWAVYVAEGGPEMAASAPFRLPAGADVTVTVGLP